MTAIRCERCKVSVESDKLDLPNRCTDRDCPLNAARDSRHGEIDDGTDLMPYRQPPAPPHPIVCVGVALAILVLLFGIVRNFIEQQGVSYGAFN